MNFGAYVRKRRLSKNLGHRAFSRQIGYDPGNWSRVEKGTYAAPRDPDVLRLIIEKLEIEDKDEFYQLAARTYVPASWGMK